MTANFNFVNLMMVILKFFCDFLPKGCNSIFSTISNRLRASIVLHKFGPDKGTARFTQIKTITRRLSEIQIDCRLNAVSLPIILFYVRKFVSLFLFQRMPHAAEHLSARNERTVKIQILHRFYVVSNFIYIILK